VEFILSIAEGFLAMREPEFIEKLRMKKEVLSRVIGYG